ASLRRRIARPPLLLESVEQRPLILEYAENDEMRVARPERLAEIVAVQGVPAESWIHDSVLPEISAATPPDRWQRAVQWMLQGEKGTTLHLLLRLPGGEQRGLSVGRCAGRGECPTRPSHGTARPPTPFRPAPSGRATPDRSRCWPRARRPARRRTCSWHSGTQRAA